MLFTRINSASGDTSWLDLNAGIAKLSQPVEHVASDNTKVGSVLGLLQRCPIKSDSLAVSAEEGT